MQRLTIVIFLGWLSGIGAQLGNMQDFTGHSKDYRIKPLSGVKLIDARNYPVEVHTVQTEDGYLLDIFRIPSLKPCPSSAEKPVVFIQHGMTSSADIFLLAAPKYGLPFMLADSCADVWLGNDRGTRYSRRHLYLNPERNPYWRFSWHEIGLQDLSAVLNYIMSYTKQQAVHYIGHSQGCTTLLVLLSLRPEFNKKIKTAHFLAPAAFMRNANSLGMKMVGNLLERIPDSELGPQHEIVSVALAVMCNSFDFKNLCNSLYMLSSGKISRHMNQTLIPLIKATSPSGISSRQAKHFMQLKTTDKFQQFDFGPRENMIVYNSSKPPEYTLKEVRSISAIHIYYSDWDTTTPTKDVLRLARALPNVVLHPINESGWDHMDFVLGKTAHKLINEPIIRIIHAFEKAVEVLQLKTMFNNALTELLKPLRTKLHLELL